MDGSFLGADVHRRPAADHIIYFEHEGDGIPDDLSRGFYSLESGVEVTDQPPHHKMQPVPIMMQKSEGVKGSVTWKRLRELHAMGKIADLATLAQHGLIRTEMVEVGGKDVIWYRAEDVLHIWWAEQSATIAQKRQVNAASKVDNKAIETKILATQVLKNVVKEVIMEQVEGPRELRQIKIRSAQAAKQVDRIIFRVERYIQGVTKGWYLF